MKFSLKLSQRGVLFLKLSLMLLAVLFLTPYLQASVDVGDGLEQAESWAKGIGVRLLGLTVIGVGGLFVLGAGNASQKLSGWLIGGFVMLAGSGLVAAMVSFWR